MVPSGASVGDYEAHELRDGQNDQYGGGNSVLTAVHNVEKVLAPALIGEKFNVGTDLANIDRFMIGLDGTKNKTRLGANAILAVSMAAARAGAAEKVGRTTESSCDGSSLVFGLLTRYRLLEYAAVRVPSPGSPHNEPLRDAYAVLQHPQRRQALRESHGVPGDDDCAGGGRIDHPRGADGQRGLPGAEGYYHREIRIIR